MHHNINSYLGPSHGIYCHIPGFWFICTSP